MKIKFLGTPDYVSPVRNAISQNFELVDKDPDLIVVASYGKILTQKELSAPKYGCINIHPSRLPKFRGSTPIQTQILQGVKESGISFIKMDDKVDHGPVLKIIPFEIKDSDTFESAVGRAFREAAEELPRVISDYTSNKIKPVPQDHSKASFTKLFKRGSGFFDLDNPPDKEKLNLMIKAFYPWPGVWTKIEGKVLKFMPNSIVQLEGKKPVSLETFLRGYPQYSERLKKVLN